MHVQEGFLFNFQMESQAKTHAFFCSSLFIFSVLASFKVRINNTEMTLMLSIFEVDFLLFWFVEGFFWFLRFFSKQHEITFSVDTM